MKMSEKCCNKNIIIIINNNNNQDIPLTSCPTDGGKNQQDMDKNSLFHLRFMNDNYSQLLTALCASLFQCYICFFF